MSAPAAVIALPAQLGISAAGALRETLLTHLDAPRLTLDAAPVQQADTAALQLLAAFLRERHDGGRDTAWHQPSEALRRTAALLGLTPHLLLS